MNIIVMKRSEMKFYETHVLTGLVSEQECFEMFMRHRRMLATMTPEELKARRNAKCEAIRRKRSK